MAKLSERIERLEHHLARIDSTQQSAEQLLRTLVQSQLTLADGQRLVIQRMDRLVDGQEATNERLDRLVAFGVGGADRWRLVAQRAELY